MSINKIAEGVYWCARDLAGLPIGNHHFILVVTTAQRFEELAITPMKESGVAFCTLATFKSAQGKIVFERNEDSDVKAVLERINPDKYTSLVKPDLDLEHHSVAPPHGGDFPFIKQVLALADNYAENSKANPPAYKLINDNCSAWVNTLFAVAGLSASERETLGEFVGMDWGEEVDIDKRLFAD